MKKKILITIGLLAAVIAFSLAGVMGQARASTNPDFPRTNIWDANMTAQRDWEQGMLAIDSHSLDWYTAFLRVLTYVPMVKPAAPWVGLDGFTIAINPLVTNDHWQFSAWVGSCVSRTTASEIFLYSSSDDLAIDIAANTTINKGGCLADSLQICAAGDVYIDATGVHYRTTSVSFYPPSMTFSQPVFIAYNHKVMTFTEIKDGQAVPIGGK